MKKYADISLSVGGRRVVLPGKIKQVNVVYDKVLVLIYTDNLSHLTRPHANGNIICLDEHGNWLWEIEHRQPTYDEAPGGAYNPFHTMEVDFITPVLVTAWNGDHRVEVDLETGKWVKADFTK